jgi:hypothetical protein
MLQNVGMPGQSTRRLINVTSPFMLINSLILLHSSQPIAPIIPMAVFANTLAATQKEYKKLRQKETVLSKLL